MSHITMSDESKRNILKDMATFSSDQIVEQVRKGKDGKINGDNLDIYVTTNDIRMDHTNKDYHFFASDWTVDRVDLSGLDDSVPLIGNMNLPISVKNFVPSVDEDIKYIDALKVLLSRVLVEYIDEFNWMKPVVPNHIYHPLETTMKKKSSIHWLPIMLKNEAKYADCVQIMAAYEEWLCEWYTQTGRGIEMNFKL